MIIRGLLRKTLTTPLLTATRARLFQEKPPPFDKTKDYFLVLKVFKDASKEDITRAYNTLRKDPKQDKKLLSDAFRVLTD